MADPKRRRRENVNGPFFVDETCIDCDTCRWMAPETFGADGAMSAVHTQPRTQTDQERAALALLSCPTASIGVDASQTEIPVDPGLIKLAQQALPDPIVADVFHCGYHARSSFGAASYLVRRPAGNVLVDSPRFVPALVERFEEWGGIKYLYLTHRDDVADHERFADHFGCERILHVDDVTTATRGIEIQPEGIEPMALAPDLEVVPVPGHTKGHTVLHYRNDVLFTGDHLAWSETKKTLIAFRRACWYDWAEQIASMERLRDRAFSWVLPGHGRRHHAPADVMATSLDACIEWMKRAA